MGSPRSAWGIDVGNRALKAIRLVRDGDQVRIDDFEIIEHDYILSQAGDSRDSLLDAALANFAQKHKSRAGSVAIGVSGQASFARFIKLPPVDPAKVADIVKFEAVQQIPFPLEDVEWSYQLFQAPDSPEIEVGIFAMRRELVDQIVQNFTKVGLEVNTVQMNPLAVYNSLVYDNRLEGTTMIIDIGAENSDLIIADGENIWMRSIPIGGNNFTEALIKSFKLKFPKAEELKRNAATSKYGRQILQAMKPVFSDLVGEIQRSIGFYSSTHRESRIAKVLALGGTFRLPGLQKYLQQNLQLDVARIDRLNAPTPAEPRFATEFNENILSSLTAYGLALQAMGLGKVKSSLLPEKIRRERMWRSKVPWFAAAAALFVVGTGIAVGKLYVDRFALKDQGDKYENKIKAVTGDAKRLSNDWTAIENSGNADRQAITDSMTLLADRDVSIVLSQTLAKAFPPIPDLKDLKKLERKDRKYVELLAWKPHYEPDLSTYLAHKGPDTMRDDDFVMSNDEFKGQADAVALSPPVNETVSFQREVGTAGKPDSPRGFKVTIMCRTPAVDFTDQVQKVVDTLRGERLMPGATPGTLSIERVLMTKWTQVRGAGLEYHQPKAPLTYRNPLATDDSNTGSGTTPDVHLDSSHPDPMFPGETLDNDWVVTVVAIVVVDPAAKVDPNAKQAQPRR